MKVPVYPAGDPMNLRREWPEILETCQVQPCDHAFFWFALACSPGYALIAIGLVCAD